MGSKRYSSLIHTCHSKRALSRAQKRASDSASADVLGVSELLIFGANLTCLFANLHVKLMCNLRDRNASDERHQQRIAQRLERLTSEAAAMRGHSKHHKVQREIASSGKVQPKATTQERFWLYLLAWKSTSGVMRFASEQAIKLLCAFFGRLAPSILPDRERHLAL